MIILHLSSLYPPSSVGGAEKVASIVAEVQALEGHDVTACSLVRRPTTPAILNGVTTRPFDARNPLWIHESAKYPSPVRLANKAATVFNFRVTSEFGALLDDIGPDVLHSHSMVELPPHVWDQAARRNVPVVHTLHDYDLLCIRGAMFKDGRKCGRRHVACRLLSAPKRMMHDRIDAVAAVSQAVLQTHLDHGLFTHLPARNRRVIWNPARLQKDRRPHQQRKSNEPLRFGFLGRLVGEKGLTPLLEACRQLPTSGWTLRIAGEGGERRAFEAKAQGLPVTFDGYVESTEFLSQVDVLVCVPLWDEPFGLTTIEAYAAGCRVIGSEQGVIGEVVSRIDPEWRVPPGDAQALASAMNRALGTYAPLDSARQSAVGVLLNQLDPVNVARDYLNLYQAAQARAGVPATANG